MKSKLLQVRVDDAFIDKLEYLKRINGYKSISDTIRKTIEKEYRKEKSIVRVGDTVRVGNDTNGYLKSEFIVTKIEGEDAYLLNPENGKTTIAFYNGCHKINEE